MSPGISQGELRLRSSSFDLADRRVAGVERLRREGVDTTLALFGAALGIVLTQVILDHTLTTMGHVDLHLEAATRTVARRRDVVGVIVSPVTPEPGWQRCR